MTRVEALTGFPECLDGRVKTLHPKVHAGLLADLRLDTHVAQLAELGIEPFDLLVSNLYPFTETVAAGGRFRRVHRADRHRWAGDGALGREEPRERGVVTSPEAYPDGHQSGGKRWSHARAASCARGAGVRGHRGLRRRPSPSGSPCRRRGRPAAGGRSSVALRTTLETTLRYGENPHQQAALYVDASRPAGLAQATQLQGKEMSYNNYIDADAAWRSANDFAEPCVAIIKHQNPCGIAVGADVAEAHRKAHACDPGSAYGGVIAVNRRSRVAMAEQLKDVFTEVIVAPGYDEAALDAARGQEEPTHPRRAGVDGRRRVETRQISGGTLAQTADRIDAPGDDPRSLDSRRRQRRRRRDACRSGIRLACDPVGEVERDPARLRRRDGRRRHGSGQPGRRVLGLRSRARRDDRAKGAVAASDAFFPFADGPAGPDRRRASARSSNRADRSATKR